MIKPRLVMHYTPGVLAVLKREDCPGQKSAWGGVMHSSCGCDQHHQIFRIVNIRIVSDNEKPGLLEMSWIK